MKHCLSLILCLAATAAFITAAPHGASADFCLQVSGASCDLSGDLGFFHFKKKLPRSPRQFAALHGRVAGGGSAFGTAVQNSTGDMIDVGVTFFADATEGQFNAFIDPADLGATHFGYASYGNYDVLTSCDVNIVSCNLEP